MTTGAGVVVESCAKAFADGTRALHPVTIEIAAGETVAILGPSGCGKTTALRIIAGLEQPDRGGRVLFDGGDVTRLPIEQRNVGMVFQSYALFPNMSVIENVAYGLRVRGVPRREREKEAGTVLAMMRIDDLAARRIDQLSGGQRQRVALARALAIKPRLLLLDEPLTALDATLREELRTEIDRLLRNVGITSVYVTHDQAEAMVLGDRIVVMEKGRIAQVGTPRDIYFNPQSRFVANFIGSMNRLEGRIAGGRFETAAGMIEVRRPDASDVAAYFRPEAAHLDPVEGADLQFVVERVHFLGASQRLHLVVPGQQARQVIIEVAGKQEIKIGTQIGIGIDPDDLLFL